MTNISKNMLFEALVFKLIEWYKQTSWKTSNDLSKLKLLKLLFLWVAKNKDYLKEFKFYSWDLWPVEKDIYQSIKNGDISNFRIDNSNTTPLINNYTPYWEAKEFAESTVKYLKSENPSLILLWAYDLVHITHKWNCWNLTQNFGIEEISENLILSEQWYYS